MTDAPFDKSMLLAKEVREDKGGKILISAENVQDDGTYTLRFHADNLSISQILGMLSDAYDAYFQEGLKSGAIECTCGECEFDGDEDE